MSTSRDSITSRDSVTSYESVQSAGSGEASVSTSLSDGGRRAKRGRTIAGDSGGEKLHIPGHRGPEDRISGTYLVRRVDASYMLANKRTKPVRFDIAMSGNSLVRAGGLLRPPPLSPPPLLPPPPPPPPPPKLPPPPLLPPPPPPPPPPPRLQQRQGHFT